MQKKDPTLIRVKCFRADHSACWAYRLHFPMDFLAKNHLEYRVEIAGYLHEVQDLFGTDVAIFQRQYNMKVFEAMRKMQKNGIKCVYDVDDNLFQVPDWNPAHSTFGKKEIQDNIKYFISNVDAIFTTTEALADYYREYNDNIFVLPNSIDYRQFFPGPNNSLKRVVMWQGSNTHKNDVALVEPALEKLMKDDDVCVKLFDYTTKIKGVNRVPGVPYNGFYPMLSQLDGYIGLAPLTTAPFNKYKSNLKYLEYTGCNMVTIASGNSLFSKDIVDGENGVLVYDNRDWYDKIRWLLDNPEEYNRILKNAHVHVKENFNIEKNYILWKNAIDSLLDKV